MKLIDTHSHLNFQKFYDDADKVILDALNHEVGMIIVGTYYKSSLRAIELAHKYEDGVYAAVGIHPTHLDDEVEEDEQGRLVVRGRAEEFNYEIFEKLARMDKVVAIGEIGLDYYHLNRSLNIDEAKSKQKKVFAEQLLLAAKLGLPVIIHCRNSHDDLYDTLKNFKEEHQELIAKDKEWGVIHCFSGNEEQAQRYFELGLKISFNGLITFSSTWDSLIRKMPLQKLMLETDCPFLTPEPFRGKRNEPVLVSLVAEKVAQIRGIKAEQVAQVTTDNARVFFDI